MPCEFALDPLNEVMLAYEMNDQPLPAEHGYPVRMVSPGCIAVRSVKWVHSLVISDEEADSAPQRRDYKVVTEDEISKVKWDKYNPVYF